MLDRGMKAGICAEVLHVRHVQDFLWSIVRGVGVGSLSYLFPNIVAWRAEQSHENGHSPALNNHTSVL